MKTCNHCIYTCKATDQEVCERFKDAELFGAHGRYKVFLTDSIEVLENELFIGDANSIQEACKLLADVTSNHGGYWRYLMASNATFVDFGSWSRFGAIIPPISMQEFQGADN